MCFEVSNIFNDNNYTVGFILIWEGRLQAIDKSALYVVMLLIKSFDL